MDAPGAMNIGWIADDGTLVKSGDVAEISISDQAIRGTLKAGAPANYPEVGVYHPSLPDRVAPPKKG